MITSLNLKQMEAPESLSSKAIVFTKIDKQTNVFIGHVNIIIDPSVWLEQPHELLTAMKWWKSIMAFTPFARSVNYKTEQVWNFKQKKFEMKFIRLINHILFPNLIQTIWKKMQNLLIRRIRIKIIDFLSNLLEIIRFCKISMVLTKNKYKST